MKQTNIISEMLKRMDRSITDAKEGKLLYSRVGWVLGTKPYINPQGVVLEPRKDALGRDMTLKEGSFVRNCPKPPDPDKCAKAASCYTVPAGVCRSCQYRLHNRRCAVLQDLNKDRSLLNDFQELVSEANRKTEEILDR